MPMDRLNNINTPVELLEFMNNNIKYGYIGNNNELYKYNNPFFYLDFNGEYFLQSPEQILQTGVGICWDQVELERYWFEKYNYEFKTYFLWVNYPDGMDRDVLTHSFLAYFDNNKWNWFEHSFDNCKGIHQYDQLEDLIEDVRRKQLVYGIKQGDLKESDYPYLTLYDFDKPSYNISAKEYATEVTKSKTRL